MLRNFTEFANIAGVRPPSIHTAIKAKLKDAVVEKPDGSRWIEDTHPAAIRYANDFVSRRRAPKRSHPVPQQPSAGANSTKLALPPDEDPLNPHVPACIVPQASRDVFDDAGLGSGLGIIASATDTAAVNKLFLESLADRTVQEVVDQFGEIEAVFPLAKAMKVRAEWQVKDVEAKRKRGDLIEKTFVTQVIIPLVNSAFRRLVSESPESLTAVIVARVLSGGESLHLDVKDAIRMENSGILTSLVEQVRAEVARLD